MSVPKPPVVTENRKSLCNFADLVQSAILALFSLFIIVQSLAAQDSPILDHARLGIALAQQGKLADAERELRAAVKADPGVASYRAQLGSVLGLQGKWKEALESFNQAVALAPQNLDFRRETAAVQWQLGTMTAAEKNLQYVLTKHPGDPGATLLLGLVKERSGDYAQAAELLGSQFTLVSPQPERTVALFHSVVQSGQHEKIPRILDVLRLHANDKQWVGALNRCAEIAALSGDLETTDALFALIPADAPEHAAAGFQFAKLLYSRGQVSQAKSLLLQISEHTSLSQDAQLLLGNCFEAERQPELALLAYQRAIEMEPSRVDHYEDLISLLLYLHKNKDALALVKHALEIAPDNAGPWVWKGNVELNRRAYADAMQSYKHAQALDRSNPDAFFGVSAVHFVTGQTSAAIADCKTGITRFPNDARFYIAYAEMLMASPDSVNVQTRAKELLDKAVKLSPQSAQAHYLLAQIALRQARLKDAEAELWLSLQSDPDRSKTHFALATVYRRTGRADEAAKELARYQELKQSEDSGTVPAMTTPSDNP